MTAQETEVLSQIRWASLVGIYQIIYPNKTPKDSNEVLAHVRETLRMKDHEIKAAQLEADQNAQGLEETLRELTKAKELLAAALDWGSDFPDLFQSSLHAEIRTWLGQSEAPKNVDDEEIGEVTFGG